MQAARSAEAGVLRDEKLGPLYDHLSAMAYKQWFNLLENPAVVVPMGRSPEGLPNGVQVVGRPYCEEEALAIASEIERAAYGKRRRSFCRIWQTKNQDRSCQFYQRSFHE